LSNGIRIVAIGGARKCCSAAALLPLFIASKMFTACVSNLPLLEHHFSMIKTNDALKGPPWLLPERGVLENCNAVRNYGVDAVMG
jgi:hypothetical protein